MNRDWNPKPQVALVAVRGRNWRPPWLNVWPPMALIFTWLSWVGRGGAAIAGADNG